jgi:hypothetical protein
MIVDYDAKTLKALVPEEFWRGEDKPKVETVGELIETLKRIPSDLHLTEEMEVTVYNISRPDRVCVGISEF